MRRGGFLAAGAASVAAVAALRAVPARGAVSFPAPPDRTVVPFRVTANHVHVALNVDGRPYDFIFDTGGAAGMVPEIAEALQLPTVGKIVLSGAGGAAFPTRVVRAKTVVLGGIVANDVDFAVLNPDLNLGAGSLLPLGGIIGREFFRTFPIAIDYLAGTLTLTRPGFLAVPAGVRELRMTPIHGLLTIDASFDGAPGTFAIDTGAGTALTLNTGFARDRGVAARYPNAIAAYLGRGIGGAIRGKLVRGSDLKIGDLTVRAPLVAIPDVGSGIFDVPDLAGNIGYGVLREFTLGLDMPRSRAWFVPNEAFGERYPFNRAGLIVERRAGTVVVLDVVPGSGAAGAGAQVGDRVVRIDGRSAATIDDQGLRDRFLAPAGAQLPVSLERDGTVREIVIAMRDLV